MNTTNQQPDRWRAACFCGAASLSCSTPPRGLLHCHCGQCRRLSGAAFSSWLSMRTDAVQIEGQAVLREFRPTANCRRFFCGQCSSHLYTLDARMPAIVGVPAGAVLAPEAGGPAAQDWPIASGHFYCGDGAAWWAQPSDELRRFGGPGGMAALDA